VLYGSNSPEVDFAKIAQNPEKIRKSGEKTEISKKIKIFNKMFFF